MSEMSERMARVLCDTVGGNTCSCEPGTCAMPLANQVAVAMLAVMRQPTFGMAAAAREVETGSCWDIWRAMIDAARGEGR